jgi:hypothetical protein
MQIVATEKTEITFIQEPYLYQNRLKGITKGYRTYTHGEGKSRAAIIISDNTTDALFITQFSDNDTVLLEIHKGSVPFYAASVYMDYNESIETNLRTLEQILDFTEGAKLILATDSNARSTTWHDNITNNRGKILEEFVASNQLHIINEDSPRRTFQSSRGSLNIDLTPVNNVMLADNTDWEIADEESASDHSILKFITNFEGDKMNKVNTPELWYIITERKQTDFYENLFHMISTNFQIEDTGGNVKDMDEKLYDQLTRQKDIRLFIDKLDETVQTTCRKTCKHKNKRNSKAKGRSVPWWTVALTIMRKRTNTLRRLYQRTKNNSDLRESRRNQYTIAKTAYQAAIKKEKTNSWKQHCTVTSPTNPWNKKHGNDDNFAKARQHNNSR